MSRDLLAIAVPARARRSVTLLHALCNHMPKPLMVCGVCLVAAHCFNDRRLSCDRQVSLLTVALMYSISFGIVVVASACYSFLLLVTIVSIEYCSTNVVTLGLLDILSLP